MISINETKRNVVLENNPEVIEMVKALNNMI